MAKNIIGSEDFIEIFVSTDITECEKRDVKGLYQKARAGLIKDFSGIDSPFEPPINPDIIIDTTNISVDEGVETLISFLKK